MADRRDEEEEEVTGKGEGADHSEKRGGGV